MVGDCKKCNIHKVQRYIGNHLENYDILSKCGSCIASFSLLIVLGLYQNPLSTKLIDLEQSFYNYKEVHNEKM